MDIIKFKRIIPFRAKLKDKFNSHIFDKVRIIVEMHFDYI